jgi:hypothetical protein
MCAALVLAPALARADDKGEIDWARRVIKARGQGAPDLTAPSISVARLGAERAAKADAMRNLLETLKGATVENGARVDTLLQNDNAMLVKVQGALRGFRVVPTAPGKPNPHYYSDGGVAIDVELPIDSLPEELRAGLRGPPPGSAMPAPPPQQQRAQFIVDASGLGQVGGQGTRLVGEDGGPIAAPIGEIDRSLSDARARAPRGTPVLRAVKIDGPAVVVTAEDGARLNAANASIILVVQ